MFKVHFETEFVFVVYVSMKQQGFTEMMEQVLFLQLLILKCNKLIRLKLSAQSPLHTHGWRSNKGNVLFFSFTSNSGKKLLTLPCWWTVFKWWSNNYALKMRLFQPDKSKFCAFLLLLKFNWNHSFKKVPFHATVIFFLTGDSFCFNKINKWRSLKRKTKYFNCQNQTFPPSCFDDFFYIWTEDLVAVNWNSPLGLSPS